MIVHRISFRYDGQLSDAGAMDIGYAERVMTGARLMLSAHAHFMTTGEVPRQLVGTTRQFRIVALLSPRSNVDLQCLVAMGDICEDALLQLQPAPDQSAGLATDAELSLDLLHENVSRGLGVLAQKRDLCVDQTGPYRPAARFQRSTGHLEKLRSKTAFAIELIATPIGRMGGSSGLGLLADCRQLGAVRLEETRRTRAASEVEYRRIAEGILRERGEIARASAGEMRRMS